MLRAMDDAIDVDVKGRRVAPNAFRVTLATNDRAAHADNESAIISELIVAATGYAKDEGYHLIGDVTLSIDTDDALNTGQCTVTARIQGISAPAPAPAPEVAAPAPVVDEPAEQVSEPADQPKPTWNDSAPAENEPLSELSPNIASDAEPHTGADNESATVGPADDLPPPIVTAAPEPINLPDTQLIAIGAIVAPDGTRRPLSDATCTIGRATENTITVPDAQASRRHAEIRFEKGRHVIVDLGSTNGTLVNGEKLAAPRVLAHGDQITLGTITLRYETI
jgi:hypothetical protein